MLRVRDDKIDLAAKKLADISFVRQNWSFGSTIDPVTRKDDEMFQRVHANIGLALRISMRKQFGFITLMRRSLFSELFLYSLATSV